MTKIVITIPKKKKKNTLGAIYNKTSSLIIRSDIIKVMHITLILTDVLSYLQNADTK